VVTVCTTRFSTQEVSVFPTEFIYMLHVAVRTNIYFYIALRYWFLGAFAKFRKATVSFIMSVLPFVRMDQLGSHWTDCREIFLKSDKNNDTSHEDLCTFVIISHLILVRLGNTSDKRCRENLDVVCGCHYGKISAVEFWRRTR